MVGGGQSGRESLVMPGRRADLEGACFEMLISETELGEQNSCCCD